MSEEVKEKLMSYSKDELVTYILRTCFLRHVLDDMRHIHIQALLDKDQLLREEEGSKEDKLFEKFKTMPAKTLEERFERAKVWENYRKVCKKNEAAYKRRQNEINKLMDV